MSDIGVEGAPFATRDASTTGGTVMIGLGNAGAPSGTSSAAAFGKTVLIGMGDEDTRSDADAFLLRLALLISSADGADPNASTNTSNAPKNADHLRLHSLNSLLGPLDMPHRLPCLVVELLQSLHRKPLLRLAHGSHRVAEKCAQAQEQPIGGLGSFIQQLCLCRRTGPVACPLLAPHMSI